VKRPLTLVALCALCACDNPVKDAKRELEIIRKTGTRDEICTASRRVADAYLKQQDENAYAMARIDADIACQDALMDRMGIR
jgi:hypothetical protein